MYLGKITEVLVCLFVYPVTDATLPKHIDSLFGASVTYMWHELSNCLIVISSILW